MCEFLRLILKFKYSFLQLKLYFNSLFTVLLLIAIYHPLADGRKINEDRVQHPDIKDLHDTTDFFLSQFPSIGLS